MNEARSEVGSIVNSNQLNEEVRMILDLISAFYFIEKLRKIESNEFSQWPGTTHVNSKLVLTTKTDSRFAQCNQNNDMLNCYAQQWEEMKK